jgi:hypothetical protein
MPVTSSSVKPASDASAVLISVMVFHSSTSQSALSKESPLNKYNTFISSPIFGSNDSVA